MIDTAAGTKVEVIHSGVTKRMNFRKSSKGGRGRGGAFSIKTFIFQISDLYTGLFELEFEKSAVCQRSFGTFPKIHPFWYNHPSPRHSQNGLT